MRRWPGLVERSTRSRSERKDRGAREPGQDEAKVVAGGGQDQVDRVTVLAGEMITLEQAVALEMPDHRLDGAASSEFALNCR